MNDKYHIEVFPVRSHSLLAALIFSLGLTATAFAQFKQHESDGANLGDSLVQRWRAGIVVHAAGGPCTGIVGYVPIPVEWPEQQVEIVSEEVSPEAKVKYVTIDDSVKIMVVHIKHLSAGQTAKAMVTFEIRRSEIEPPEDTEQYVLPNTKKLSRKVRAYLGPSPKIESRNRKIRSLAKQIAVEDQGAWQRVEAIYDWVRDNIKYKNGPIKGAMAALKDGSGDCEELTSLFIALCRAGDIPARTVWVPGHCYPQFYLEDAEGNGHWFPCQAAGSRSFGGIPEQRPILQKGDNFRPPWNKRQRQRYLAEHLTGTGGQPRVKFVREKVAK